MALDRDAERVLEMVRLSGRPPYETLSAPAARELFLAAREVLAPDPPPVASWLRWTSRFAASISTIEPLSSRLT